MVMKDGVAMHQATTVKDDHDMEEEGSGVNEDEDGSDYDDDEEEDGVAMHQETTWGRASQVQGTTRCW